jgi:osmoprotectant transport system ATP-binding protein
MPDIELKAVSKTFHSAVTASLHPVTLTIPSGQFVTILGASGSGKTTLLKLINRLHDPSSGSIYIDNRDIATLPETALRRGIGYVIQQTGLFQHMTVGKNIAVVPEILGWPALRIADRIDELLELVGLNPDEYRNRYPRQLSGGQQQRVGLARALAGDPEILLMDEPFGAIDPITRQRLQDELLAIQSRLKKTVVFVTHDVQEALRLGDKTIIMNQGRVQQYDTPSAILQHPADAFVSELIATGEADAHLTIIRIQDVWETLQNRTSSMHSSWEKLPTVSPEQTLRDALQALLRSPVNAIQVITPQGGTLGEIHLEDLQRLQRQFKAGCHLEMAGSGNHLS